MPTSSEFVALCQVQIRAIQALGATLSIVYLTEKLAEDSEAKLIPIAAYPSLAVGWEENDTLALLPDETETVESFPGLPAAVLGDGLTSDRPSVAPERSSSHPEELKTLFQQRRIVLPLIHEGMMMGLLVTEREDRPWNQREQSQLEGIAHTMAIACILDQRHGWLEKRFHQQQRLQAEQNDLLHNLLHQLRNPLTALRTFGKLLLKRLGLEDRHRDIAANILRESDRLQELLQQFDPILELTGSNETLLTLPPAQNGAEKGSETVGKNQPSLPQRLLPEAGLAVSSLESCSVAEILKPLLASARAIAAELHLNLPTDIPAQLPPVLANAKALREVLSNIIDNALKYTPSGGEIEIQVGQTRIGSQGQMLGIAISDTGPGIPPQDLEHLFERHYRGVQAQSEIPGTGLGLAIARDLVEQMQGDIQVISPAQPSASANLGHAGTTFIVWLRVLG